MIYEVIPSLLFIQIPVAIFMYFDSKKRMVENPLFWTIGIALFLPFFLPFYLLLRPRKTFFYCPVCEAKNMFPSHSCPSCGMEIKSQELIHAQGEWKFIDVLTIIFLSLFIIPMSLGGLANLLGILTNDWTEWSNMFYFGIAGSASLILLSIWFVVKVCKRPLSDVGLTSNKLYRNILLGIIVLVPAFFIELTSEELIVRSSILIFPSQSDYILKLQEKEHSGESYVWPETSDQLAKLIGATFLMVVLGPIGEEILFRGLAYSILRQRRSKLAAIIIVSIIFALAHSQIIHFMPIFIMGIILAYLYERTGSIVPSIALHSSINLLLTFLWYYRPDIYT